MTSSHTFGFVVIQDQRLQSVFFFIVNICFLHDDDIGWYAWSSVGLRWRKLLAAMKRRRLS